MYKLVKQVGYHVRMLYEPLLRNVLRVQYVLGVIQQLRGQNFAFF